MQAVYRAYCSYLILKAVLVTEKGGWGGGAQEMLKKPKVYTFVSVHDLLIQLKEIDLFNILNMVRDIQDTMCK